MKTLLPRDMQESNERMYSRHFIDGYIRNELDQSELANSLIDKGTDLVKTWLIKPHYPSKQMRVDQIARLNTRMLVIDILVGVAYFTKPEQLVTVAAKTASRLGFNDKEDAVRTAAELLAILCETNLFDITKSSATDSLMLTNNMCFSEKLNEFINQSMYLPPMVCEPLEIKHNRQSGYLTFDKSVLLKSYNHHDGDVCLDVLNTHNKTALSLSVDFLLAHPEQPSKPLDEVSGTDTKTRAQIKQIIRDKHEAWELFQKNSNKVYMLMINQGNRFYLNHAYDKRGRLYAQGYHINSQGAKHKKAMLELADKELVTGVPT